MSRVGSKREQQVGETLSHSVWEDRNVRGKGGVAIYALLRNLDFSIESDGKPL